MNQNVMLFIDSNDDEVGERYHFDTVAKAQQFAATRNGKLFEIYTLYTRGEVGTISWKLATDHSNNVLENKKAETKMRKGAWTQLEIDTLTAHFKANMPLADISRALKRKYNSVYTKLTGLGLL